MRKLENVPRGGRDHREKIDDEGKKRFFGREKR